MSPAGRMVMGAGIRWSNIEEWEIVLILEEVLAAKSSS